MHIIVKNIFKYLGAAVIMYICIFVVKSLFRNYMGMFAITLVLIVVGIIVYFSIMCFMKDDALIGSYKLNKFKSKH